MCTYIQINSKDNAAIVVQDVKQGTELLPCIVTLSDVLKGHKIAMQDIPKDALSSATAWYWDI